ncbi:MAG: FAD-dependent oxidoreductase [Cyanobacteria bacterium P01_F01_bin.3]
MNRKEFILMCGIFGLSVPLSGVMKARSETDLQTSDSMNIIIIGAGAAGLAAGYLLKQQGIEFQILEASSIYGGRMKQTNEFANFPIPLGAEWIHVKPDILEEIINDDSVGIEVATTQYDPNVTYALYEGNRLSMRDIGFGGDSKFINSTWFDFFDQYIIPFIEEHIVYDAVVEAIDYSTESIQVRTQNDVYVADQLIITVPVKMLQNGAIDFTPALPNKKQSAIDNVRVWDGCKAFIEFSQKFYPTAVAFNITPEPAGQKLYYDASYGQHTTQQILGLFAVGTGTIPYINLEDNALIEYMLNELDVVMVVVGPFLVAYIKVVNVE